MVKELEVLDLGSEVSITENTLRRIYTRCTELSVLRLTDCIALTDHQLVPFCKHLKRLRVLELRGCKYITNAGLANIGKTWSQTTLRSIVLIGCPSFTLEGVESLLPDKHRIESIVIVDCEQFKPTQQEFDKLRSKVKSFIYKAWTATYQREDDLKKKSSEGKQEKDSNHE